MRGPGDFSGVGKALRKWVKNSLLFDEVLIVILEIMWDFNI